MAGKRESRRIFDTVQILPRPREARQNASSVCQTRSCTEPRLMGQVHLNFHKVWHVTQNVDVYLLVCTHSCTRETGLFGYQIACKLLDRSCLIAIY